MKKINNKGFSLVEIIIVIAIMAILIGVMAPQLIKYIENAKAASDESMLNDIYAAVVYASSDPAVFQDPDSKVVIDEMMQRDTANPYTLDELESHSGTLLYKEVIGTLGWADLDSATCLAKVRSKHTSSSQICFVIKGTAVNPITMWITYTDINGRGNTDSTDPEDCIHIQ